jgi:hypothetical protein
MEACICVGWPRVVLRHSFHSVYKNSLPSHYPLEVADCYVWLPSLSSFWVMKLCVCGDFKRAQALCSSKTILDYLWLLLCNKVLKEPCVCLVVEHDLFLDFSSTTWFKLLFFLPPFLCQTINLIF